MRFFWRGGGAKAQTSPLTPFNTWISDLPASQYTVTSGTSSSFNCDTTPNIYTEYLGSCFGNNAATPYTIIAPPPPPAPTYYNLPSYVTMYFNVDPTPGDPPMYDFYQLGNNEAIVTIILLPPLAAYYSFQSYVFERQNISSANYGAPAPTATGPDNTCSPGMSYTNHNPNTGAAITHSLSDDCKYQEFGFFGNAINNVDVLANSGLEFNSTNGNPTQAIAIITTANRKVLSDLTAAFSGTTGLSTALLFPDPVPGGELSGSPPTPSVVFTGLDNPTEAANSDVLGSVFRYTLPQNGEAGTDWVNGYASNVVVYRVLDNQANTANPSPQTKAYPSGQLYTSNTLLTEGFNTNEVQGVTSSPPTCPAITSMVTTKPYLCDIIELKSLLFKYLGSPASSYSFTSTTSPLFYPGSAGTNGLNCILTGVACYGGTQDNDAYDNLPIGELMTNEPAFVIGVDHATSAINNAYYMGVSTATAANNIGVTDTLDVNSAATGFGITSVTNQFGDYLTEYLSGSASTVVQLLGQKYQVSVALTNDAPNLYVASFDRLASGDVCGETAAFYCQSSYPFVTLISSVIEDKTYPYIAPTADILLTERGYMLPQVSPAPPPTLVATGAAPPDMQPAQVLYYNPNRGVSCVTN